VHETCLAGRHLRATPTRRMQAARSGRGVRDLALRKPMMTCSNSASDSWRHSSKRRRCANLFVSMVSGAIVDRGYALHGQPTGPMPQGDPGAEGKPPSQTCCSTAHGRRRKPSPIACPGRVSRVSSWAGIPWSPDSRGTATTSERSRSHRLKASASNRCQAVPGPRVQWSQGMDMHLSGNFILVFRDGSKRRVYHLAVDVRCGRAARGRSRPCGALPCSRSHAATGQRRPRSPAGAVPSAGGPESAWSSWRPASVSRGRAAAPVAPSAVSAGRRPRVDARDVDAAGDQPCSRLNAVAALPRHASSHTSAGW